MTKLFMKHFAKHIAGIGALFAVMSAFAWAGNFFLGHHLYGMMVFISLGLLFLIVESSWREAKREAQ